MRLDDDDFALMGLPRRFALEPSLLDERRRQLQAQVHPDRHVADGAAAQRVAMQWAVRVNEAYQRLKQPLTRAAYLCELNGHPVRAEDNTAMPAAFLEQQMAWREALDASHDASSLATLAREVDLHLQSRLDRLATLLDAAGFQPDWGAAVAEVRALLFVRRFQTAVHDRLDTTADLAS